MGRARAACPSRSAYMRHRRLGEEPCPGDIEAARAYHRAYRRARGVRPAEEWLAAWSAHAAEVHPCGTVQAAGRHYSRGEPLCDLCRQGYAAWRRERRGRPGQPTYDEWLASLGLARSADGDPSRTETSPGSVAPPAAGRGVDACADDAPLPSANRPRAPAKIALRVEEA